MEWLLGGGQRLALGGVALVVVTLWWVVAEITGKAKKLRQVPAGSLPLW